MDWLKTDAPFWKKEETDNGTRWVTAKSDDDDKKDRWKLP
jgi:molybdopterin synthase catalytic subunit